MKESWGFFLALVVCINAQQFSVPPSTPLVLRVDEQGRAFLAAGRQLLRLDSELNLEQNATLPDSAISISLGGAGGRRLVVCTEDASCAVYNASNFAADVSLVISRALAAQVGTVSSTGLYTAGNTFYAANHDSTFTGSGGISGRIRLVQVDGLEGPSNFMRSTDYNVLSSESFERIFFGGFVSGSNAYYIATDLHHRDFSGMRVMRVCDTNCGGTATCSFLALYEETIFCGSPSLSESDGVCGLSVVEDFAGTQGTSILVSRCHPGFPKDNLVCLVPVTEIDRVMGTRFSRCQSDSTEREELFWRSRFFCSSVQPVRATIPNMAVSILFLFVS